MSITKTAYFSDQSQQNEYMRVKAQAKAKQLRSLEKNKASQAKLCGGYCLSIFIYSGGRKERPHKTQPLKPNVFLAYREEIIVERPCVDCR